MHIIIILCGFFLVTGEVFCEWQTFKTQFEKNYVSVTEEKHRQKIFFQNKRMIEDHNEKYRNGEVSFELEMNQFGDMSDDEFAGTMFAGLLTSKFTQAQSDEVRNLSPTRSLPDPLYDVPKEVDWRKRGGVTPVKFQGRNCGSCWAFSATGALEGHYFSKTGKLIALSEQNLVDCSSYYGNEGCNGGIMDWAFQYVIFNGGLDTEESYPYEGTDSRPCRYNMRSVGVMAESYVDLSAGDEEEMKIVIASQGPVSVGIHAHDRSFRFYKSGVYYEPKCNATKINHGVLVVGYGTSKNNQDYWLVKNSWGKNWGDSGYIKMARNRNNNCGIVSMASYPLIDVHLENFSKISENSE